MVLNKAAFDEIIKPHAAVRNTFGPNYYAFCVQGCMLLIADWCAKNGYDKPVQYVFAELQKQSNVLDRIFKRILNDPKLTQRYRTRDIWGKGIMKRVPQLQAADVIAYEATKRCVDDIGANPQRFRKSFVSLGLTDYNKFDPMYFDKPHISAWITEAIKEQGYGHMLNTVTPF